MTNRICYCFIYMLEILDLSEEHSYFQSMHERNSSDYHIGLYKYFHEVT